MKPTYLFPLTLLALLAPLTGCSRAERSAPLPGDSVSQDGAVTLSPPRLTTAPPREHLGAIESKLFPPELVMEHQNELAIQPAQRDAILAEVERAQAEIVKVQWEMQGEKEKLVKLLDAEKVDEAQVSAAAARVMERESRVKALHLTMLVRVKNTLDANQQKKLRELREPRDPRAGAGPQDAAADAGRAKPD